MARMKKRSKSEPLSNGMIHLEGIRRIRSLGNDFGRLGYDPFMVKLSKSMRSRHFF